MRSTLLLLSLVKRKWLSPANMVVSKSFLSSYAKQKSARELSILFYGSDDFSIASLKLLHKKLLNPGLDATVIVKNIQVVTTKCNNPVSLYCKKTDLPITLFDEYTVPNDQFDLGVVSSFGRLIPSQAINACHFGIVLVIVIFLFSNHFKFQVFSIFMAHYCHDGVELHLSNMLYFMVMK